MHNPLSAFTQLSEAESDALKSLAMLAATTGAGYLGQKLDLISTLSALKGESEPPPWLVDLAELILKYTTSPVMSRIATPLVEGWMERNGIPFSAVVSLARRFAPLLDLAIEEEDDRVFFITALTTLASRVRENSNRERFKGIVNCPSCRFVFLV